MAKKLQGYTQARYDRDAVIADYRTGNFSLRELGKKHGVSHQTISRVTKDLIADLKDVVAQKLNAEIAIANLPQRDQKMVNNEVIRQLNLLKQIDNYAETALDKACAIAAAATTGKELKDTADAVDKISVTVGVNERHAAPASTVIGVRQEISASHAQRIAEQFIIAQEVY